MPPQCQAATAWPTRSGPEGTAINPAVSADGQRLVRTRRAADPPAAPASRARSTADAALHRGQHPPCQGGGPAIGAGASRGFAISRWPGGPTGSVSPCDRPFHGLDDVEDTRARHDAPSPVQSCTGTAQPCRHRGLRPHAPQARRQRQRRSLPPSSTEQPAPTLIRKRLPGGSAARGRPAARPGRAKMITFTARGLRAAIRDRDTVRCGPAVTAGGQRQEQLRPLRPAVPAGRHGTLPPGRHGALPRGQQ
jgi:hypothetical protein